MPKVDLFLNPGDKLPDEIADYLNKIFHDKIFDKLFKFGGRIQISITAPYNSRKKNKSEIEINSDFIKKLQTSRDKSETTLKQLSMKQLKEIGKVLNYPIASKSSKVEVINNLLGYLFSKETWKGISQ